MQRLFLNHLELRKGFFLALFAVLAIPIAPSAAANDS